MEGEQPATPARAPEETAKRESLRRKGAEYFEQVLAKAAEPKDPIRTSPRDNRTWRAAEGHRGHRRTIDLEKLDPDHETVGLVLEGLRLYAVGALFVVATAASPVFLHVALEPLQTAGVQAFLHLLPSLLVMWVVVDVGPLTPATVHGSAFAAVTYGLQTLCTFGALLDGSVLLYVGWTMLVPPALGLAVDHRVLRGRLPILAGLGLVVGGLAPLVALGTRSWPELRSLVYLVIWTVVEAVVQLWNAVRVQPEAATSWMRPQLGQEVRELVAAEGRVDPAALAFLRLALPAAPLLLLGFLLGDGPLLLEHELSVPAVTAIILSAIAWAVAALTGLLIQEAELGPRRRAGLALVSAAGSVALSCLVGGLGKPGPLLAVVVAVLGGCAAQCFRSRPDIF